MPAGLPRTFCNTTLTSHIVWAAIGVGAILLGNAIDQNERDRCSKFRDKSKMFGVPKMEGEKPTWGSPYKPWL